MRLVTTTRSKPQPRTTPVQPRQGCPYPTPSASTSTRPYHPHQSATILNSHSHKTPSASTRQTHPDSSRILPHTSTTYIPYTRHPKTPLFSPSPRHPSLRRRLPFDLHRFREAQTRFRDFVNDRPNTGTPPGGRTVSSGIRAKRLRQVSSLI